MSKPRSPRKGSLQFWPRKRAKSQCTRIKAWSKLDETKLLGFAGYKAGMTTAMIRDNSSSITKGQVISAQTTIIECPPIKPLSLRFYQKTPYGLKAISEIYAENLDKLLARKINLPKKKNEQKIPDEFDDIRLIVYTQPRLVGTGKKKPEIFELAISGNKDDALKYAKELLKKNEIKVSEIFKEGQLVDIHAVTKGQGYQGATKRFGLRLRSHKSEKGRRGPGSLGPWHSRRIWSVAHPGQMGYHSRTEYNKLILKISNDPKEINQKGGLNRYGLVKNDYILVKGSIPGPKKRLIKFVEALRPNKKLKFIPDIIKIKK